MHNRRVGPLAVETKLEGETNMASSVEEGEFEEITMDSVVDEDNNYEEDGIAFYIFL